MQLIVKYPMKLILTFNLLIFCSIVNGAGNTLLNLDFEQYLSPQQQINNCVIIRTPSADNFVTHENKTSKYLFFNGVNDNFQIKISDQIKQALDKSFTFEFDFKSPRLPTDRWKHNSKYASSIEVFAGVDDQYRNSFSVYLNQYNRFTLLWINAQGKKFRIDTSWNYRNNYELASLQRNKWYHIAIVNNQEEHVLELYVDNEKLGKVKTNGVLRPVSMMRFGGKLTGSKNSIFIGCIDDVVLTPEVLYNKDTNAIAMKKAWQRLYNQGNDELKKFLLPENPNWANHHPKMILTPSRIKVLKENLQKGRGPELVKLLLKRCDAMMNPKSRTYFKELPRNTWNSKLTLSSIEFMLATVITGDEKYAKYAVKLVMDYTNKLGYYDVTTSMYMPGEGMVRQMLMVTLAYDWGYKYFTPEQRQKIRLFLLNIAKGTYTFYTGDIAFQSQADSLSGWASNWSSMAITTLGLSSLAILGETSAKDKLWLNYASFRAAQYGTFAIGKDGCFHEMVDYFAYGSTPILLFMDALYTAGGDDLIMETNFSKFTDFLPYVTYPYANRTMALKYARSGISGLSGTNSFALALLRQRLKNKQTEWCWQFLHKDQAWFKRWEVFALLWFEPKKAEVKSPDLPLAKWFKSEGFVAFRSDWNADAIAGIFMAYPAKMVSHEQSDRGQFTLYGYKGRWIIDTGRGTKQHNWRDSHNLITVDDRVPIQKARLMTNFHEDAFMTNFCTADNIMTAAEADLTLSYRYTYAWGYKKCGNNGKLENPFKNAKRKIIYMREKTAPSYLLVLDDIQEDETQHTYTLNLHTDSGNEVVLNENGAIFYQQGKKDMAKDSCMTLLQLAPVSGFKVDKAIGQGRRHPRLKATLKAVNGKFLNIFYPHKLSMQNPVKTKIDDNTNLITWKNCSDLICVKGDTDIDIQGIKTDADLALIRKKENKVISFVMLNGSYLSIDDKKIITLDGDKGVVGWTEDTLALNGEEVYNFTFNSPNVDFNTLKNVTANGKKIEVKKASDTWKPTSSFVGQRVLSW